MTFRGVPIYTKSEMERVRRLYQAAESRLLRAIAQEHGRLALVEWALDYMLSGENNPPRCSVTITKTCSGRSKHSGRNTR